MKKFLERILNFFRKLFKREKKKDDLPPQSPVNFEFSDVFSKIAESARKAAESLRKLRVKYTPWGGNEKPVSKHSASKNHNVSEPKYRRVMARESNKINRARIKRWKY